MFDDILMTVRTFRMRILISFSGDEILLMRYVKWLTNFTGLSFNVETSPSGLKFMNFVLSEITWKHGVLY